MNKTPPQSIMPTGSEHKLRILVCSFSYCSVCNEFSDCVRYVGVYEFVSEFMYILSVQFLDNVLQLLCVLLVAFV